MTNNFKNYRIAKQFAKDLPNVLKVLDLTERALELFKHYLPVRSVLNVVKNEKAVLQAHLETSKKIIDSVIIKEKK